MSPTFSRGREVDAGYCAYYDPWKTNPATSDIEKVRRSISDPHAGRSVDEIETERPVAGRPGISVRVYIPKVYTRTGVRDSQDRCILSETSLSTQNGIVLGSTCRSILVNDE